MLDHEQAQTALEKVRDDRWIDVRLSNIKKLPKSLQTTGRSLIGVDENGKPVDPYRRTGQTAQEEMARALFEMPPAQRKKLVRSLFPKLADSIEAAWELHERLPYQSGWGVRPFRAASKPAAVRHQQVAWLAGLVETLRGYPEDVSWIAAWAPHLGWGGDQTLGTLLAAVLDAGGEPSDRVFEILKESASNEHEVGVMGRHVTRALLCTSRPECWEFIEKLLLAAQRQEGLRQTILESIDAAHPEAFRRMLSVILEHNLGRFSATVRAIDVWFGFLWDSVSTGVVKKVLTEVIQYLDDPAAREAAIDNGEAESAYLALWTLAFHDGFAAIAPAATLLNDAKAERRWVAAHLLGQLRLLPAREALIPALADEDLRVAVCALDGLNGYDYDADMRNYSLGWENKPPREPLADRDVFERLEREIARFPKKQTLKPIVWPWVRGVAQQEDVAQALIRFIGTRERTRLIPYLPVMNAHCRSQVVRFLAQLKEWDAQTRETLFALAGDLSGSVREEAVKALKKCTVTTEEAAGLETLLKRKSSDLRRGILAVLLKQDDAAACASADRLLAAATEPQRLAGLEMLRTMIEKKRRAADCRERAQQFQQSRNKIGKEEQTQLDTILDSGREVPTLKNALGLIDPEARTVPPTPKRLEVQYTTKAAEACLLSLYELVESHRETTIRVTTWEGEQDLLLGNAGWQFPVPDFQKPVEESLGELPLADVWQQWYENRPKKLRDADGLELVRALLRLELHEYSGWGKESPLMQQVRSEMAGTISLKKWASEYQAIVERVLMWLLRSQPPAGAADYLLDGLENSLAVVAEAPAQSGGTPKKSKIHRSAHRPASRTDDEASGDGDDDDAALGGLAAILQAAQQLRAQQLGEDGDEDDQTGSERTDEATGAVKSAADEKPSRPAGLNSEWRGYGSPYTQWINQVRAFRNNRIIAWTPAHDVRFWQLLRWLDEPGFRTGRQRPELEETLAACAQQAANEHDVIDHLLGVRGVAGFYGGSSGFEDLGQLTGAKPAPLCNKYPLLADILQRCRERILEIELARGEQTTAASQPALALRHCGGLAVLVRTLAALGKAKFARGYNWGNESKPVVFSHLVRTTLPGEDDTPAKFAQQVKAAGIDESRLLDVAVYAPQWAGHVEAALKWPGLEDGVWWIHAHTKDDQWTVDAEIRESWTAAVSRRTPLSGEDLVAGGVDVAWFHRIYGQLKPARWTKLLESAKYASGGGGHKRAELFAEAMLGRVKKAELIERIHQKRHQDSVRALGLLPLSKGKAREADVLDRYKELQEFIRTSRQFGSQRQTSEKKAATIGMENLARTAGFPDPLRLQWAMEAKETADLAAGPVVVTAGDVSVSLSIDAEGKPNLAIARNGKSLKSLPAAVKKNPDIAALRDRRTELKRQASRMRQSLETAMCRGDEFTGGELKDLFAHPVLAPMLGRLVLVGEGIMGYPVKEGRALEDIAGKLEPVKKNERLRIAHPLDLLASDRWHDWQSDCFQRERVQPFKQLFRELYVLTAAEQKDGTISRRYAGHQVHPRQAMSLLGGRGWVNAAEEGVCRTFHDEKLTAWIEFQEPFFTPADIEGLTLEGVRFSRRGDYKLLPLTDVPPRIFSEVMRDLDLVVSVAHRGGVDPEASASTIEMRSALLTETCTLLELDNVRIKDAHALVKGELGEYSVHLGSAVTHRQPGGALFIVAVHSQHRGRLFLPFADDDPKTAEVLSKVILLARDREIQDPNILEQLRR